MSWSQAIRYCLATTAAVTALRMDWKPVHKHLRAGIQLGSHFMHFGNISRNHGHNLNLRVHILDAFQIPYQKSLILDVSAGTYEA